MTAATTTSLTLPARDAETVSTLASALGLPPGALLGQVVARWLRKPKKVRRLAKRLLDEAGDGKGADARRKALKSAIKQIERARREPAEATEKRAKGKRRARTTAKAKTTRPAAAARDAAAPSTVALVARG